ncbi:MAG TPA: DUF3455 domain-containing protein [Edaphobacter sp.]|nr:DUF3455 domain-containing protein [Edaphobacter sp.]
MPCQGQQFNNFREVKRDFADESQYPSMFITARNETRKRKQRYVFRSIWLVATCFLPQAYAQTLTGPIDVPKSDVLLLKSQGKGAQIYGCVQGNWMLIGPDAKLLDEQSNVIGRHYIGPTWQLKDGSLVTGKAIAKNASSDAQSVPWLLLEASSGTGEFKAVKHIQRRDTHGGVGPSTPCSDRAEIRVPYTANYLFYVAHP